MRSRRTVALLLAVGVVTAVTGTAATATTAADAGTSTSGAGAVTSASRGEWQHAVAALPAPVGHCFTAAYPVVAWHATPCTAAPTVPFAPATGRLPSTATRPTRPTVGNGNDYSAVVPGLISEATGAFTHVSPGITEKGRDGAGRAQPNIFSLQLNSEFFTTPACSRSSDPSVCQGWQQFIYDSAANIVFMQYWLIDYGAGCPAAWNSFEGSCYTNSNATTVAGGPVTAPGLATTELSGTVIPGGTDAVELSDGTQASIVENTDGVLTLSRSWNTSEFGVFGDGGGSEARFGGRASLEETTTLVASSDAAPACVSEGFTGETDNLKLTGTPALGTVLAPTIGSAETDGRVRPASCATAAG